MRKRLECAPAGFPGGPRGPAAGRSRGARVPRLLFPPRVTELTVPQGHCPLGPLREGGSRDRSSGVVESEGEEVFETRAEKVGWKTARTQVDARRARRMSTVCGGARGRRGRGAGTRGRALRAPLRSGPGEVVGGGRGVQARAGLGAEVTDGPPQPEEAGKWEGPRGSCSRRLEGKFAAPGQRASGRPRPALEPPPGKGLPALGGARALLWCLAAQRGGQKGQNRRTPQAARRLGHERSLSVSLGVFSQSCRKAEGAVRFQSPGNEAPWQAPLTAVRAPSPASKPPGAAALLPPPGAGNILMACTGREPGMTPGSWQQAAVATAVEQGVLGDGLKRHLFL